MTRLHVEGWAPEYGASVEPDESMAAAEGTVDVSVEGRPWEPVPGADDGVPIIAFVDGVRRIDARLLLDDPSGPVPGLCGSFGVGAAVWDRDARRSTIEHREVSRVALLGSGRAPQIPELGLGLEYESKSVDDDDPASLVRAFHDRMRRAEARLTEELAGTGMFVVADGPLYEYTEAAKVGVIKSHRRTYLPSEEGELIGSLPAGHRTPLFSIGVAGFRRYSWYVRLAPRDSSHTWHGIVRCEASAAIEIGSVAGLADRTAAILPLVASLPQHDPRAPQNLVPIAALERDLRHRLGDSGIVLRALRTALAEAA